MKSRGEERIQDILLTEEIPFKREYSFSDLKSYKNQRLRFDFQVNHPQLGFCLIEYHGQFHYEYNSFLYKNKLKWRYARSMDIMKARYALLKKIPLYIIPYTDFNQLVTSKDIFKPQYLCKNKYDSVT